MPKYEDFKVGDTWIYRDGREDIVLDVSPVNIGGYNVIMTSRGGPHLHRGRIPFRRGPVRPYPPQRTIRARTYHELSVLGIGIVVVELTGEYTV
jgi:hypothetical protein